MTVLIKVDQAAAPPGVPGQAREDLVTGVGVTLTAVGGPFLAYQWSIVSKPIDITVPVQASSLLGSPTANTSTLSPIDVAGTYLVEIAVDSGSGLGAGIGDVSRITFYAGPALAADPTELPRRTMAAFESTEHNVPDSVQPLGNTEGWSREWYRWFAAIRRSVTLTLTSTINAVANSLLLRNAQGEAVATAFVSGPAVTKGTTLTTLDATPTTLLDVPLGVDAVLVATINVTASTPPLATGLSVATIIQAIFVTTAGVLSTPGVPISAAYSSYVGPSPTIAFTYAAGVLTFQAIGLALTQVKWVFRIDYEIQLSP